MSKHTPGPWTVSELGASGNVSEDYIFIEPCVAVIERKVSGQDECDMPDACLIAAAPDLLEALAICRKALGAAIEFMPINCEAAALCEQADIIAAIEMAKATGEQQ